MHGPGIGVALLLVTLSAGCAFETQSVGLGNGGLEGNGVELGGADDGNEGGTETTTPGTTAPDTSAPNTLTPIQAVDSTDLVVIEPACIPGTERSTCPGTSCDPMTLTCTTMKLASRGTCETCFADSNCASMDERCVWMTYRGEPFPDKRTGFCLKLAEPVTIDGRYACEPPFSVPLANRESPSGGKNQTYCGIHEKMTTCFAVRAFHNRELCPSGRDDECPAGGLCRAMASTGNKTEFACTYGCTEDAECSTSVSKVSCSAYCGG